MSRIDEKYKYDTTPLCDENACIYGEKYRFTVLTPCLIRMEYSEKGIFENRATQIVINRSFDVPDFKVIERGEDIIIITDSIELTYTGGRFTRNSVSARFRGEKGGIACQWRYGDTYGNMKGTARTLDEVDGECVLDNGIMSRVSMTAIDDSKSLILADDGWIDVRDKDAEDVYLFAYGRDYLGALKAFYKLTGAQPLLPRYALGNWWSRYYKYSQNEYEKLMLKFEEKGIPFSVAVLDMDWHKVDIETRFGSGWTGFSWDRELFPEPDRLIEFLVAHGKKVTLNLHPAEGVAAHEDRYNEAAEYMGIDTSCEDRIPFDVGNPKFIECYFETILHPLENDGVAFWWMDWQQGNTTKIPGLDPLWMLNHFHCTDMMRRNKRPMLLSRYSGLGSHRYPVGFSGDTVVTWDSLDFQPYFTANASNAGYGWWSHDIGGHMQGVRDDELVTRWVQLGVFSPIMRLHSTLNDFQSKEPWNYNAVSERVMTDFLRLRHRLIPYLYSMNYKSYSEGEPLVQPMYYKNPNDEAAYECNRNEYYFGSELLVSPITSKADGVTLRGAAKTYLPDGIWFDLFNPRIYQGGRCLNVYRDIYTMPVFAKAGAIVPMAESKTVNDIGNPKTLRIAVFPGSDNEFCLYEDDGESMEYLSGKWVKTRLEYKWGARPSFIIHKPQGDEAVFTKNRSYIIEFRAVKNALLSVTEDGMKIPFEVKYRDGVLTVQIDNVNGCVEIRFTEAAELIQNNVEGDIYKLLLEAQCENAMKQKIYSAQKRRMTKTQFAAELLTENIDKNLFGALLEIISAYNQGGNV